MSEEEGIELKNNLVEKVEGQIKNWLINNYPTGHEELSDLANQILSENNLAVIDSERLRVVHRMREPIACGCNMPCPACEKDKLIELGWYPVVPLGGEEML